MSDFFEKELRKLFEYGNIIPAPEFVGRACIGSLGGDLRVKAQFVTMGVADHYAALRLTILNRTDGEVDRTIIQFKDVLGRKKIPNNPNFPDGLFPHIWTDRGKSDWYAYHPNQEDYAALRQATEQYLDVFREPERGGPKMIYICAPLRGDVEQNIEFARQKAQEVFQQGDIPICPHLMFPPIADPKHPAEDLAAREMGLRLVESCQQLNVYGTVWTDGMWAEIHRAEKLGIPVMTDQKTIGRPPKRNQKKTR